jgi:hypothetical protein
MRLSRLERGHRLPQKLMLRMIRLMSRDPSQPLDIIKTMLYRPEYFGRQASDLYRTLLRGPSEWSVGERELFAAFTSSLNACRF